MELSSETKCLIIVGVVVAVVFLINYYSSQTISKTLAPQKHLSSEQENEHFASMGMDTGMEMGATGSSAESLMENSYASESGNDSESATESFSDVANVANVGNNGVSMDARQLKAKFQSKNRAHGGKYKHINYAEGQRASNGAIGDYFDDNNALVKNGHLANDKFTGFDEVDGKFASYKSGNKKKLTDEEIFNVDNFLPKETNKDWFEVMPEPISVKNRHLINTSRPIGVNTIGTSLRNPSYDIRGSPPCPKFVVSPWLQSTIEPDYNLKGLC